MILVDTSVWVDHLRSHDASMSDLLDRQLVLTHPFVIGELAMGSFKQRDIVMEELQNLPQAMIGHGNEVLSFITHRKLFGLGIGYIDAHLLVAAQLTQDTFLWTRDKRLFDIAQSLSLAYQPVIQ